ncbi:MAG: hypothetical protein H0T79_14400, partial [Deltaproteobacteria bacterium]|nr:hypothetical protein [Deltaproteobacteria bacterium]
MLERLIAGVDSDSLERLARHGLIETTTDARVPLFRRAVRPSDRVLDLARGKLMLDRELAEIATLESA